MKEFIKNNKSLIGAIVLALLIYFFGGTVSDYFSGVTPSEENTEKIDSSLIDTLK